MSRRDVARLIIRMRHLLILGLIARLVDDAAAERWHGAEFNAAEARLPLYVTVNNGLYRYINAPASRKINREGILAQSSKGINL